MSLYALFVTTVLKNQSISKELVQEYLSGNLCRCTGYRPIVDAALSLNDPNVKSKVNWDERNILINLLLGANLDQSTPVKPSLAQLPDSSVDQSRYDLPQTLEELLQLRAQNPGAQLIAGATDAGIWITKGHQTWSHIIDLTQVKELSRIHDQQGYYYIGAAVNIERAFKVITNQRPELTTFANRFAALPVRQSATLAGNIANGSPIGDSMPLLIALGSSVVLMRCSPNLKNERADLRQPQNLHQRELFVEELYLGYRRTVIQQDEVLAWIKVPKLPLKDPEIFDFIRAYKLSKRFEDDISAVCLCVWMQIKQGLVIRVRIGVGGVAEVSSRAYKTEQLLTGREWTHVMAKKAGESMRAEFTPISDMRASAGYRSYALAALWERFWLEIQGESLVDLSRADAADSLTQFESV
jgi:xanthine dehydrogenase small subunit